jgi:hypothetical protein
MPGSILPDPPAAGKQKLAMSQKLRPPSPKIPVAAMIRAHGMSQNLRPPSSGERPSMSWAIKQKTGHGSEVEGAFGKNSCCVHDSNAWDESELAAALAPLTTEYQLGRQTKARHGSEVDGNTNFDLMKAVFMQCHK